MLLSLSHSSLFSPGGEKMDVSAFVVLIYTAGGSLCSCLNEIDRFPGGKATAAPSGGRVCTERCNEHPGP